MSFDGVAVGLGVAVLVAVGLGVGVLVAVGLGVAVLVAVGLGVGFFVAVGLGLGIGFLPFLVGVGLVMGEASGGMAGGGVTVAVTGRAAKRLYMKMPLL